MLNSHYISIKPILSRLFKNPLMEGLNEMDAAQYIDDCLRLIGAPMALEDKVAEYTIEGYKASLPLDMLYIQQTRKVNRTTDTSGNNVDEFSPMRYSSDTFHSAYHEVGSPDFADKSSNYDWTYVINNGIMTTNFETGIVQQSYKGLVVDDDGLPMIPDHPKFIKAIENYIKVQHYTLLFELGKISERVLNRVEQEAAWYIGGANTAGNLQNIDQAESFRGAFTKVLNNSTAARRFFQDFGRQEFIKKGRI